MTVIEFQLRSISMKKLESNLECDENFPKTVSEKGNT